MFDEVVAVAQSVVDSSATKEQRDLLQTLLERGVEEASAARWLPCIEFPLRIAQLVGADDKFATTVAAACLFVYLGADVLDNVADDELPRNWDSYGASGATLAGATALGSLTYQTLCRLEDLGASHSLIARLCAAFAAGMGEMAAGQQADVAADASLIDGCLRCTELKSGSEFSLFGRAAAMVGTNDIEHVEACGRIGFAYGTALQIASDVFDLWRGEHRDAVNGTRTLPVVHALSILGRAELAEAIGREDTEDVGSILAAAREAGSLHFCTLIIEGYVQKARHIVNTRFASTAAADGLIELIESPSMIPAR